MTDLGEDGWSALERRLRERVSTCASPESLSAWLATQEGVGSVKLENYVIKTFPPRCELTLRLRSRTGERSERVLTIEAPEDGPLAFVGFR